MKKLLKPTMIVFLIMTIISACQKKDDFLNVKPDQSLIVASTVAELKGILLNENLFNVNDPATGTISDGDVYVTSDVWTNSVPSAIERNTYIWAKDIYQGSASSVADWNTLYQQIYSANTVLEGLQKINSLSSDPEFRQTSGMAHFFRACAFYNLVQTFALPYAPSTASSLPGIPLKVTTNIHEKSSRASIQASYDQIIADLIAASTELQLTAKELTTPTKVAAYAMLSRVFLAKSDFANALKYADFALSIKSDLVDFNNLTPGSASLSTSFLPEDILHLTMRNSDVLNRRKGIIEPLLYQSYALDDLRRSYYFIMVTGALRFRGTYDMFGSKFTGLATDELLLNRAECYARQGDTKLALDDLNTLLVKRWKAGTFVPYKGLTTDDALKLIITERRKELLERGIRWTDIRRLNQEGKFKVSLTRVINGVTYSLPPNDPKFAFPIPLTEINLSNMPQNER